MKEEIGKVLTPGFVERIEGMLQWFEQNRHVLGRRKDREEELPGAPDVYIGVLDEALAAMTAEPGTGTDSSEGRAIDKDEVRLFRIDDKDPNIDIDPIGIRKTVYNVSTSEIANGSTVLCIRDKAGKYIAVPLASAGGSSSGGNFVLYDTDAGSITTTSGLTKSGTLVTFTSIPYPVGFTGYIVFVNVYYKRNTLGGKDFLARTDLLGTLGVASPNGTASTDLNNTSSSGVLSSQLSHHFTSLWIPPVSGENLRVDYNITSDLSSTYDVTWAVHIFKY